ncbi:MAG: sigma-70 family RNA polymerase sigma factor [Chitinophaga sp.]|uniref:RNA polymerase sigma factor n=1 Tax=Chitinophaga sp. TaxID=1869181 RepID=UPI001B0F843A|nr:sigma-70 family RNA polymerase sigma factor [Chitinophaga sp.]MBO9731316.1 sigma-70 family RNA polymerase sigma factor [Chitinophaga sp.]
MRYQEHQWLEEIYKTTLPTVARMVYQMGGHLEMAKDIFQDAVIIYLEKQNKGTLPAHVSPAAYITGIARICCLRKMKQSGRYTSLENISAEIAIPEDYYGPPPVATPLLSYLKAAGKRCLQLLQAFYYDQHSIKEIADDFHFKSLHSASVQKYKCLEKVRTQLQQSNYAETVS